MGRLHNNIILGIAGIGVALAVRERARQRRSMSFAGKVALITGGSRGLGLEIARQLGDKGAKLALCARNVNELERAREELERRGAEVFVVPCDITDRNEVEQIVHSVQDRLGPVDVLVNNAGVIQVAPVEEMTEEDFEEAMKVHFWAPLYMSLAVLPGMRQRGRGRIVNISSIGGRVSIPHLLPYSASKFALVGLSEGMRAELARERIYVTTACPGLVRTGSHVHARFKGQHTKEYAWFTISNASPLLSTDVHSAAREIVHACKYGDAEVTFPLSAKCAAFMHGMCPGFTADMLSLVNRLLPGAGGIGQGSAAGKDSQSALAPSVLTGLSDKATVQNNETQAI